MGLLLCCFLFYNSCNSQTNEDQNLISATIDSGFAKGADVGWLPQMEATGYKFYDTDGTERDCLQLLKDRNEYHQIARFVNPSDDKVSRHCSKEETVVMALRAQKMGMRS
jgi:arabinogalactan endo-1,4-beta-galactosidase